MNNVVIVSASRTPISRIPGSLSSTKDVQLMASFFNAFIKSIRIDGSKINEAYVGCSFPGERDNLCRKAILAAGLPQTIPGTTITRTCASSMEAVALGAYKIMSGDAEIVLAGGVESMSTSPYVLSFLKKSIKAAMKNQLPYYDVVLGNLEENEMAFIAEMLARKYNISREEQDVYALESHRRARNAQEKGVFNDEIIPIEIPNEDGRNIFRDDEFAIKDLNMEAFEREPSLFIADGSVTNCNSASVADAAAAMLLMSEEKAKEEGFRPLARIIKMDTIGVSGDNVGLGTVEVVKSILHKANLSVDDIDLFECNEAFGAQAIVCQRLLGIDSGKLNVNGGSIAMGYPVGCTGMRICVTLLHEMRRRGLRYGVAAICAGGGMGQGMLFEGIMEEI